MDKLKKMMNDARNRVAEKSLFLSPEFAKLMQAVAMGVTKLFKKAPEMVVYQGPQNTVAYTDSEAVHVNFGHFLVQNHYGRRATLWEKINAVKALVMHEAAHIAKTDFALAEKTRAVMETDHVLWPLSNYADIVENAGELEEYCAKGYGETILRFYHDLDNILEDSYINNWLRCSGRKTAGLFGWFLKKEGDCSPSFEEMLEHLGSDSRKYDLAVSVLLDYAKFGMIRIEDPKNRNHEIIRHLEAISDEVDGILDDDDAFFRCCHGQKIFCHYWPYLRMKLDAAEALGGSSENPDVENENAAPAPTGMGGASVAASPRSSTDDDIELMMSSRKENDGEGVEKAIENSLESSGPEEENEGSEKDTSVQRLLETMAGEEVNRELDAQSEQNLGLISKEVNGKYPGERLVCSSRRIAADDADRKDYDVLSETTGPVTKALVKYFLREFRDMADGEIRTGLFSGTGIDWNAVSRDDPAEFYKEDAPSDEKPLAVCYLGDESGSMAGKKAEMNRLTAITVYNFCDMLGLPVGVYGHTSASDADCDFRIYADFRKDPLDRYRMMHIEGDWGNKDGYALRLASERLLSQPAENRVLIITSDGLPSDYGSREEGIRDIQDCIRTYSRKGIRYIAAAMDEDKETIRQIYGTSFLDITDLSGMPKKLVMMLAGLLK